MVQFVEGKGYRAHAICRDNDGKRREATKQWFKLKRDAKAWEESWVKEHRGVSVSQEEMTVRQIVADYIKACKLAGRSPNTISGYEACQARINRYLGDSVAIKLTRLNIESAYSDMLADNSNLKISTIGYAHRVLRAAYNYAIDNDVLPIQKNPCRKVVLPQETHPFKAKMIHQEQAAELLGQLKEHDGQLYLVALLCLVYGFRRGEALGLRWIDVDFAHDKIHLCGQYTYGTDKTPIWKERMKTSSSRREVYLDPYIKSELLAVHNAFPPERIVKYVCELDGVLPSPSAISKRWQKFCALYGYEGVRMHDLRHSAAMMMLKSGANTNTVKNILGHTKLETTERYLHDDFSQTTTAVSNVVAGIFPNKQESHG